MRIARLFQRREDRPGQQHSRKAEEDHHRLAADPVAEQARKRLQQHEQRQRRGHDPRRRLPVETDGVGQVFLHVGGVGVEGERAAGGQRHHQQRLARMIGNQVPPAGLGALRALRRDPLEMRCFGQPPADDEDDDRKDRAQREGDPPAPRLQRRLAHRRLQQQQQRQRQQLAGDQGDILEAGPESAPFAIRPSR